jgi:diaminohydroxyphosphoribosylaminopyrimidine deaminase / 5-amino-6-(5-phosphoribosylamino)uracil reductase
MARKSSGRLCRVLHAIAPLPPTMPDHDRWMHRCLELARLGAGGTAPNPMVGAVLVQGDRVLAEGWHKQAGGPHAEVECLREFGPDKIPADAVLYVNLEPCSHQGRTPPCADLLIAREVKHVVVGCVDPNPLVQGEGIARARARGINVVTDVLHDECRWLNRRFIHHFEAGRPYVILKWARSVDGFLDDHGKSARISSPATDVLVHQWRSEEQAILVGSLTVLNDDPALTVRHVDGRNPLRVVLDRMNRTPSTARFLDDSAATLLVTNERRLDIRTEQLVIREGEDPLPALLAGLKSRGIISVIVEGGAELLGHFIRLDLWDEARVITGAMRSSAGTMSPMIAGTPVRSLALDNDTIDFFVNIANQPTPQRTWHW